MLLWILLAVFASAEYADPTYATAKASTDLADYASGAQATPQAALACPPGTFFEGSSCEKCPAGKVSPTGGMQCTYCPIGTFSYDGIACTQCAAGKSSYALGMECVDCPSGKFSYNGMACQNCAPGKSSHAGGVGCEGCDAGKYSVDGSVCVACVAGTFSNFGSSTCTDCPVGTTSAAGAPSLSMCMSTSSMELAPPQPEEEEWIPDAERAPMQNALELHNEAEEAQERAQEAQHKAESEMAEAQDAHHQKMEAEAELFEVKEKYVEVFNDKINAEENQRNANVRYEEERFEAEKAEREAQEAKVQSEQASLRAFEASHAVKMESEGEAASALAKAKKEADEHFEAKQQYKQASFHAEEQESEYQEAEEKAEEAIRFAKKQHAEAEIAQAELMAAETHLEVQKVEAMEAETEAEEAHREHEIASEHHQNVLQSQERGEMVWEELVKDDCVNDPKGLVSTAEGKTCEEVGDGSENPHWDCHHFDEDFNGHATFIWELCPVSCHMCGTDRDQYYEEHHHKDDEEHDLPECLRDCDFDGLDLEDEVTACPWWKSNGPEHNVDSCFNDCSPGVMYYVEHHVQRICHGGPDNNPLECAMDCPIDGLNPHTAESFCPWFSAQKNNMCFADCSDKFLDMAQAHAEHTCFEYELEGDKFTSYIQEPLADAIGGTGMVCQVGFYPSFEADEKCEVCPAAMFSDKGVDCEACPSGLTSFPASTSPHACFVRQELIEYHSEDESFDGEDETFDSENESFDDMKNESYDEEEKYPEINEVQYQDNDDAIYATVEPEYTYDSVNQYETYAPEAGNWETKNYQETVYHDMTTYPSAYPTKTYDETAYATKTYETVHPEAMTYQQTVYPEPMTYQHTTYPANTYQETVYPTEPYYPQAGGQSPEMYTQTVYPTETYPTYPTETYPTYPTETYPTYPATMTMQPEFQVPDYHTYTATAPSDTLGQYAVYTDAPISTNPTPTEYSQAPEAYTPSTANTLPAGVDASQLP